MEFFEIADIKTTAESLSQAVTMESLPKFCASIHSCLPDTGKDKGEISCVWGRHRLHRDMINGGVRFSLDHCQNALAWTISTGFPPCPDKVVIHCTINRPDQDPDLVQSIKEFVANWKIGLEKNLTTHGSTNPPPLIPLAPL